MNRVTGNPGRPFGKAKGKAKGNAKGNGKGNVKGDAEKTTRAVGQQKTTGTAGH